VHPHGFHAEEVKRKKDEGKKRKLAKQQWRKENPDADSNEFDGDEEDNNDGADGALTGYDDYFWDGLNLGGVSAASSSAAGVPCSQTETGRGSELASSGGGGASVMAAVIVPEGRCKFKERRAACNQPLPPSRSLPTHQQAQSVLMPRAKGRTQRLRLKASKAPHAKVSFLHKNPLPLPQTISSRFMFLEFSALAGRKCFCLRKSSELLFSFKKAVLNFLQVRTNQRTCKR